MRTHDGNVYAISNYDPFSNASVLARGIVGSRSTAEGDVPFVASPMHKQAFDLRTGQCLDDADVRIPTYDVRVLDGDVLVGPPRRPADLGEPVTLPLAGYRIGVTAARKVDEQVDLLERRGADVVWAPAAVDGPQPGRRRVPAGGDRGRAGAARRPVPRHDRHRDEGVVRRRRVVGAAARPAVGAGRRRDPGPRAQERRRAPSARAAGAVGAGLGVLRRRARPPARTAPLDGRRIVVQEHGQSLSMVAHALRRQGADVTTVTVYRVASADDPEPMFRMVDLVADRALQAVTFTSAPAVAAMMEAAGSTGRRDDLVGAFQADVLASCVGPVTAAAFEMWGVPTIFPDRSRLAAMVKQLETELPSRHRRHHPGGRRPPAAGARRDGAARRGRDQALPRALRRAAEPDGQPRTRRRPAATCSPRCPRAPPAPSTRSRWRSPGCARRSAPGPCRPWSSAATGWRSDALDAARDRRARHPAPLRQPGRPRPDRRGRPSCSACPPRRRTSSSARPRSTTCWPPSDEPTVVVPLLLSTGHHVRHDLPASLAAGRAVPWSWARPRARTGCSPRPRSSASSGRARCPASRSSWWRPGRVTRSRARDLGARRPLPRRAVARTGHRRDARWPGDAARRRGHPRVRGLALPARRRLLRGPAARDLRGRGRRGGRDRAAPRRVARGQRTILVAESRDQVWTSRRDPGASSVPDSGPPRSRPHRKSMSSMSVSRAVRRLSRLGGRVGAGRSPSVPE